MATETANHFHVRMNFEIDSNDEPIQCGFFFMASDVDLPEAYAVNEDLPTKEIMTGFWSGSDASGTYTTQWLGQTPGTSLHNATDLTGIAAAVGTYANANKALWHPGIVYKGASIIPYNIDRVAVGGQFTYTLTTPIAGTGTQVKPPFNSLAVGWRGVANGQSQRGRMYLPANGASMLTPGFTLGAGVAAGIAQSLSVCWGTLWGTYSVRPVIVHRTPKLLPPGYQYGSYSDVATIRVGNLIDTFKSRGNSLVEGYSNVTQLWP